MALSNDVVRVIKQHKRFIIIYLNILAVIFLLYALFAPAFLNNLPAVELPGIFIQMGASIFVSSWMLVYPFLGRIKSTLSKPIKFIIVAMLIQIGITIITDLLGFYPGKANFDTDYRYGEQYFNFLFLNPERKEFLELYPNSAYYPPGCSIFFVLLYIINPWESVLFYRIFMMFFKFGMYYVILKIFNLKKLNLKKNSMTNGLFYFTFSGIELFFLLFYQKFDFFMIFISMVGIYYLIKEKWLLASIFLVYTGFFKIYSFLWLGGVLLVFLKKRDFKRFKKLLFGLIISGTAFLGIFLIMEGFTFIKNLLEFGWHFTIWEEVYNVNWSYFLKFLNIPFMNYLPPILIVIVFFIYIFKYAKQVDFALFINITIIILLFYPSISYHYLIWIIPLISVNFMSYAGGYRRATFVLEIIHVNLDYHTMLWTLIWGYQDVLQMHAIPAYTPEIVRRLTEALLIRIIAIIPMIIGLFLYMTPHSNSIPFYQNYELEDDQNKDSKIISR